MTCSICIICPVYIFDEMTAQIRNLPFLSASDDLRKYTPIPLSLRFHVSLRISRSDQKLYAILGSTYNPNPPHPKVCVSYLRGLYRWDRAGCREKIPLSIIPSFLYWRNSHKGRCSLGREPGCSFCTPRNCSTVYCRISSLFEVWRAIRDWKVWLSELINQLDAIDSVSGSKISAGRGEKGNIVLFSDSSGIWHPRWIEKNLGRGGDGQRKPGLIQYAPEPHQRKEIIHQISHEPKFAWKVVEVWLWWFAGQRWIG